MRGFITHEQARSIHGALTTGKAWLLAAIEQNEINLKDAKLRGAGGLQFSLECALVVKRKQLEEIAEAVAIVEPIWAGDESEDERCEGCAAPATTHDADDVPLCKACFQAMLEDERPEVQS